MSPPAANKSRQPGYGAVVRTAAGLARTLAEELAANRRWDDAAIHRTRVFCKKLRAVVHLGRGLVGKRERRDWNERIRQAARALSTARDGAIMLGWLEEAARHAPVSCTAGLRSLGKRLRRDYPRRLPPGGRDLVLGVLADVAKAWPELWGAERRPPVAGLRHMQEATKESAREAEEDHHREAWHLWRRRVKYLAYQMEWLALAGGRKPSERYRKWRKLGSALGKVNDMHNLEVWLDAGGFRSTGAKFLRIWAENARFIWEKQARTAVASLRK